jgi:hypothetical protein
MKDKKKPAGGESAVVPVKQSKKLFDRRMSEKSQHWANDFFDWPVAWLYWGFQANPGYQKTQVRRFLTAISTLFCKLGGDRKKWLAYINLKRQQFSLPEKPSFRCLARIASQIERESANGLDL